MVLTNDIAAAEDNGFTDNISEDLTSPPIQFNQSDHNAALMAYCVVSDQIVPLMNSIFGPPQRDDVLLGQSNQAVETLWGQEFTKVKEIAPHSLNQYDDPDSFPQLKLLEPK